METFYKKALASHKFVVVALAHLWFNKKEEELKYPVLLDCFVLGSWYDFHDGVKSNIEGKTTIAIFYTLENAEEYFKSINK